MKRISARKTRSNAGTAVPGHSRSLGNRQYLATGVLVSEVVSSMDEPIKYKNIKNTDIQ